jgi:hypothetical protein
MQRPWQALNPLEQEHPPLLQRPPVQALPSGFGLHFPFLQAWHSVQLLHFFFFFFLASASFAASAPAIPSAASRPTVRRRESVPARRAVKASKWCDSMVSPQRISQDVKLKICAEIGKHIGRYTYFSGCLLTREPAVRTPHTRIPEQT